MKLTGPACTEATNEAEKAERRERAEDNAGGVRVEREVRHPMKLKPTRTAEMLGFERTKGMPPIEEASLSGRAQRQRAEADCARGGAS
jgi:hypothetical protein